MPSKIPRKLPPPLLPSPTLKMDIHDFMNDPMERIWTGPFSFVIGADPQFGMIANCKFETRAKTTEPEMKLTREAIRKVNAMSPKPKFFIFCGDMLDALPFDREILINPRFHDVSVRNKQYKDFVKVLQDLDPQIKPIFVCGNHDIGDFPTTESITKYRSEFGPDFFAFWVGGVKFVVLNSQYYYSPRAVPAETSRHWKFIENKVEDAKAKHIVVFQHIPFFGEHPEEPDLYCNIPKERRLRIMEKYHSLGVRHVFCGHYHRNAGGSYRDIQQVVTASMGAPFGDDPSGFMVVHVGQDEIKHEYIRLRETTDCKEFETEFNEAKLKAQAQKSEVTEKQMQGSKNGSKQRVTFAAGSETGEGNNANGSNSSLKTHAAGVSGSAAVVPIEEEKLVVIPLGQEKVGQSQRLTSDIGGDNEKLLKVGQRFGNANNGTGSKNNETSNEKHPKCSYQLI